MNIKELLNTRFKVIAKYPNSNFSIGEIVHGELIFCDKLGDKFSDYPHLFQKLKWWEERLISEMPIYIKSENQVVKPKWKQEKWRGKIYFRAYNDEFNKFNMSVSFRLEYFEPATEEEFNEYTSKCVGKK